jgi:hypothetical protein
MVDSGYGVVLKALQKSTGQMVAIKQFRDNDQLVSPHLNALLVKHYICNFITLKMKF